MHINLAILYGIDDKFGIVKDTIRRCYPYFDNIFIINSGGELTYNRIKLFRDNKVKIYNIDNLYGDTSSPRRYAATLCKNGDWILWLDSDECPSQLLLDNLENFISEKEMLKQYHIKFGSSNHLYDDDGKNVDTCNPYHPLHANYPYNYDISIEKNTFPFNRMIKVINEDNIGVSCSFGGHSIYSTSNGPVYSNFLINHYKTLKTCYKSATFHLWSTAIPNHNTYEMINKLLQSEEYNVHMNFIKKYEVQTSVKLVSKLTNFPNFIDNIRTTYYTPLFRDSIFHWNHIYKFLDSPYNFDLEDDAHTYVCNLNCCNYKL